MKTGVLSSLVSVINMCNNRQDGAVCYHSAELCLYYQLFSSRIAATPPPSAQTTPSLSSPHAEPNLNLSLTSDTRAQESDNPEVYDHTLHFYRVLYIFYFIIYDVSRVPICPMDLRFTLHWYIVVHQAYFANRRWWVKHSKLVPLVNHVLGQF